MKKKRTHNDVGQIGGKTDNTGNWQEAPNYRKRESKAVMKFSAETPDIVRDEQGKIQFEPQDFENALIVNFITKDEGENIDRNDLERFI